MISNLSDNIVFSMEFVSLHNFSDKFMEHLILCGMWEILPPKNSRNNYLMKINSQHIENQNVTNKK